MVRNGVRLRLGGHCDIPVVRRLCAFFGVCAVHVVLCSLYS